MLNPVEVQYREFIESVMNNNNHHEAFIRADSRTVNNAHIEYLPESDSIIVDYRFEYPATVNNIPAIRRAVYRALMY